MHTHKNGVSEPVRKSHPVIEGHEIIPCPSFYDIQAGLAKHGGEAAGCIKGQDLLEISGFGTRPVIVTTMTGIDHHGIKGTRSTTPAEWGCCFATSEKENESNPREESGNFFTG
jgi:hypothetical protein